jgi:hypothetical protein
MARPTGILRAEALELLKRAADLEQQVNALATLAKNAAKSEVTTRSQRDADTLAARHRQRRNDLESQLRSVVGERFRLLTTALAADLPIALRQCEDTTRQETEALEREHLAALTALAKSKLEKIEDAQALDAAYGRQLAQLDHQHQQTVVAIKRLEVQAAQNARFLQERAETAAVREVETAMEELQKHRTDRLVAATTQLQQQMRNIAAGRAELLSRANALQAPIREGAERLERLRQRLLARPPRTASLAQQLEHYTTRLRTAKPDLPQQLRNWADADWQPFMPPTTPPRNNALRVGYRTIHTNQSNEIPVLVNLFERSQLWLRFSGGSTEWSNLFLGSLVLRLFATLPPTHLRLVVFDPVHLGSEPELRVFANHLKEPEFRVIVTASDLERQCDELIASAPGIGARLPYHYKTVFAMNRDAATMKEKHTVILLRSLPKPNDTRALDKLKVIVETGHVSGFHVVGVLPPLVPPTAPLAGNRPAPMSARPMLPTPAKPPPPDDLPFTPDPIIEVRRDTIRVLTKGRPLQEGTPDVLYAPVFVAQTLSAIRQNIENPRHIPRQFNDFIARGTTRFAASSIDVAEVPLAYDYEYKRLINIRFDCEHFTHALIVGMSGQGKSSVLHRIITGLASRYSPDEVQFVLIDDKDGVEFDRYRQLPHVRLLSLRGSYLNTLATLEYLGQEMDTRYLTMRGQADSIARYRKKSDARMPRLFLVWDEAYEAFTEKNPLQDRVIDAIRRLAEKGRAAGIHLVLATNHGEVYQIRRVTDMMPMRINLPHKHTDVFADWHRGSQSTVPKRKGQAQFVGFDAEELERPQLTNLLEPELERTDEWWTSVAKELAAEATRAGYECRTRIFDGTALIDPAQHATQMAQRISTSDQRTTLFLGESISRIAEQPVSITLTGEATENLLYLGGRDVFPLLMARQAEFLETSNNRACEFILCAAPSERLRALLNALRPTMTYQPGPFDPYQTLASLEEAIASGERHTIFIWGLDGIAQLSETPELISHAPSLGANIVAWSRAETLEQLSNIDTCLDSFAHKAAMTTDRHMFSRFTDTPFIDPGPQCATLIEARRTTLAFAPYTPNHPLIRPDNPAISNVKPITG